MNKLFMFALLMASFNAFAQTFNVSTTPELRQALLDAAGNGQDDTIVLADGTYMTTDDGLGTFVFLDTEIKKLSIVGSSRDSVIISGDGLEQIITFNSMIYSPYSTVEIDSISFIDANYLQDAGGAIYAAQPLIIRNCKFLNNHSKDGGGVKAGSITIINSVFMNNSAVYSGGGFRAINNTSVTNSFFVGNTAQKGGGLYVNGKVIITNSIFESNIATDFQYGGAMLGWPSEITNSIFVNNSSGVYIGSTPNSLFNNIFKDNNGADIVGYQGASAIINNNYISEDNIVIPSVNKNNIFSGVALDFVDELNSDFHLASSSGLIDSGAFHAALPDNDLDGYARVAGGSVDIGPYEYSTTRPTINSFTYAGVAQEQSELTFSVDYTLTSPREVSSVMYDYLNDGVFSTVNTHAYNAVGTYTVNAKITDSAGEFSVNTISVVITELPYNQMTYEQKLIEAIDPEYYNDLTALVQLQLDTEVSAATASGIATGKQYVQNNLAEFNLVTTTNSDAEVSAATASGVATGKQYVQNNLAEFNLVTTTNSDAEVSAATASGIATGKLLVVNDPGSFGVNPAVPLTSISIDSLTSGWHNLSTPVDISDMSIFVNVKIVWYFDANTNSWLSYSSNPTTQAAINNSGVDMITLIKANSGLWVEK